MTKKKLCFDLDGVICTTFKKRYFTAKPKKKIIKLINELYKKNTIIVFTARFMGRNKENIYKAKKMGYKKTYNQLKNWGLKFHYLYFGKPSYDIFVDDKAFGFSKNSVSYTGILKKFLE
jgi:hypothetical protein